MSQVQRLKEVLSDGHWHDTPEILARVYGLDHSGIARISARVFDLNKKLPPHQVVECRRKNCKQAVWEYRIATVDTERHFPSPDLFGHAAEAV